jgi:hypothetical protein
MHSIATDEYRAGAYITGTRNSQADIVILLGDDWAENPMPT